MHPIKYAMRLLHFSDLCWKNFAWKWPRHAVHLAKVVAGKKLNAFTFFELPLIDRRCKKA